MEIDIAIQTWGVFWLTYWIFGSFISWKAHVNEIRKVTEIKKVVEVLFVNMLWTLFATISFCFIPLRALTNSHIIVKMILTYLITDIYFFHFHLMLHQKKVYPFLHKKHHYFEHPWALTALYCTGYEAVFLNALSVSLGPVIFQMPSPYIHIWFFIVALNSVATHSGLKISFLIDGEHDIHHSQFSVNFGVSPYLDMLYGTRYINKE